NFEYSSNITAVIYQNGEIINSENILLGAFHNDECRGVAAPIEVLGQWMFFLTVYSNTLNDTITYKAYFSETEEIMMLNETTLFMNNQILGNPLDPFIFNITIGTLEAPQNLSISVETNDIILRWDKVTNANSYKVFASDSPDGTFFEVTDDGIFGTERDDTITWTVTIPVDNRKFYYVVASTD
ncbi:MAG: hypothetical protein KAW88_05050, partial [Candidatus Cloacimonetes bacterium]|nr:hypothetical protein [Candidatus Cloacimonadota bacterium]